MPEQTMLLKQIMGSRLYGTFTDQSDYDYKEVIIPPLDSLLLNNKVANVKKKPEGIGHNQKMLAGETETELIPIQIFMDDFFSGQTYAIELAFAVQQRLYEGVGMRHRCSMNMLANDITKNLISRFLTADTKKMAGYAMSQAQLYGLKTERLQTILKFIDVINAHFIDKDNAARVAIHEEPILMAKLLQMDFVKEITVSGQFFQGKSMPGLLINNKQFPLTRSYAEILSTLHIMAEKYGSRVKEFSGAGADFKALSHAIRITEQIIELSETGSIVFPRPNAKYLRAVKSGKVLVEDAMGYLQSKFDNMDSSLKNSVLKQKTAELEKEFTDYKIAVLRKIYIS